MKAELNKRRTEFCSVALRQETTESKRWKKY